MGLLSHRVERSEIEGGDHIYTWKTGFTYSHHGIYVGANKVVHFTREQSMDVGGRFFVSSSRPTVVSSHDFSVSCSNKLPACSNMPDCGFQKHSGVLLSCLDCFLGGGSLYRFEYGVNPLAFFVKLRGGTCTTAKSDAPRAVIHRSMYLLHSGFGNYDVFENNCEDFSLYCKTGLLINDQKAPGRSGQVYGALGAPLAALLSSPLRLFMSSPIGIAAAGTSAYCLSRYSTDIGVRTDVLKVEVEDMVLFHGSKGPKEPTEVTKSRIESHLPDQNNTPACKRQRHH